MPRVLLEHVNPYHTRRASLLADRGDLYLYLSTLSGTGHDLGSGAAPTAAAVWVANLGVAPKRLQAGGSDGRPARMGRDATMYPLGCPPPRARPELVWFEEGDGVALIDADGLLAVIPGSGGRDGFNGYARYCRARTPLAWPLTPQVRDTFDQKVADSRSFWNWRLTDGWKDVEASGLAHLRGRIGPQEAVWRVDGGSFPEMAASRHRLDGHAVWITSTTGLSAQPMPQMDDLADPPRRIELAVGRRSDDDRSRNAVVGPASIPFSRMTGLTDGHIVHGQSETSASLGPDTAAVLLSVDPPTDAEVAPPDLSGLCRQGEAVTWLWVLAMDRATLAVAEREGSEAALAAIASAGRSWVH